MTTATKVSLAEGLERELARFADHLNRNPKLSDNTRTLYPSRVRQYLHWLENAAVLDGVAGDSLTDPRSAQAATSEYERWMRIDARRTANTINSHASAVVAFYAWLGIHVEMQRQDAPPTRRSLDLPARDRLDHYVHTCHETRQEAAGVTRPILMPADKKVVFWVLRYAGLRRAELVRLDVGDVSMTAHGGSIVVRHGKGGRTRTIPIAPLLRERLNQHRNRRIAQLRAADGVGLSYDAEPLFVGRTGRRLGEDGVNKLVAGLAERAHVEVTPHVLRHTFATQLREAEVDQRVISSLLGHSGGITSRYTAVSYEEMEDAMRAAFSGPGRRKPAKAQLVDTWEQDPDQISIDDQEGA